MPTLTGQEIHSFQVSTDDQIANLKELKLNLLDTLTYNEGRRVVERTRGGDAVARYQVVKPNPSIELSMEPDTATNAAYRVLLNDTDGNRVFRIEIPDGSASQGAIISGRCTIDAPIFTTAHADAQSSIRLTLRPVGAKWSKTIGNLS